MNLQSLVDLLRSRGLLRSAPVEDPVIGSLAVDSREVRQGALFFAYPGVASDGHDFVSQAIANGAIAIVVERPVPGSVPVIHVHDARAAAEVIAMTWYHDPMRSLRLFGITGTNGKSTTTAMLRHLLGEAGDCGSIGTIGAFDGAGEKIPSTAGQLTTPGPVDLQQTFRAMVERGVRTICMEASSHALEQGRLDRVAFDGAIFTNLTREHLDYHPTMEQYLAAKLKLASLVTPTGILSVNADDAAWNSLHADARTITWGSHPEADLRITELTTTSTKSHVTFSGRWGTFPVEIPQPGEWNVANAAGATAIALGLGMPLEHLVERLSTSPQVPGRMELLASEPFHVLRDYAHTPDAVERLLTTVRDITPGRVILVFGCGGDRDRGKRPIMGEIAARGADLTILTTDNPRHEDPDRIIDDIVERMPQEKYLRRLDRAEAIGIALDAAHPGDTVVLMGKGHETYQIIGDVKQPFDERTIVKSLLG